jgi:Amidase
MTIKEAFNVAGLHTTWGNPLFRDYVAARDATVVARLKQAGAIVVGKTNVHFMLADFGQTANDLYGVTNNPWAASFGDTQVMLADEFPEVGVVSPLSIGGAATVLRYSTAEADAVWERAIEGGAEGAPTPARRFLGRSLRTDRRPLPSPLGDSAASARGATRGGRSAGCGRVRRLTLGGCPAEPQARRFNRADGGTPRQLQR